MNEREEERLAKVEESLTPAERKRVDAIADASLEGLQKEIDKWGANEGSRRWLAKNA